MSEDAQHPVVALLVAYRNWIGVAGILVGGLVVAISLGAVGWRYTGIPPIPLWGKVALVAAIPFAILGVVLGALIGRLVDRDYDHLLVSLGLTEDSEFGIWGANQAGFEEIEWEKDAHEYPTTNSPWRAWEVVDVDEDEKVAKGTWRGSASQREMAQNAAMIEYAVETMEAQAQRGEYVWANRGPLLREALRRYTRKVNSAFESATLPGVDALEDVFGDVADDLEDVDAEPERDRPDPVDGVNINVEGGDDAGE